MGPGALILAALTAVANNRFRTILALLGITIGVGSVIAIAGLGDGAKLVVRDALSRFGAGSLMVQPNYQAIEASDGRYDSPSVTREDIAQINAQADAVRAVTPQANWTGMSARRLGRTREVEIYGTLHHYLAANSSMRLARGRFLHPEDDRLQRKVAVLGAEVAADLFPDAAALGALISLDDWFELEVIGILAPEEHSFLSSDDWGSADDRVFVPISTVERVTGFDVVSILWGEADSLQEIETAKQQILAILDANHGRFDGVHHKFVVHDWAQLLSTIESTTGTITALVSILGVIALVVAGIGVMNIMLVSVRERTREIGTRKALGAQPAAILNQFVVEAVLVCGGGGLAGIGLAAAVIAIIEQVTGWPAVISLPTVRLAFLLSFGTGLVFGLYPASRAARMAPVEALRHE